MDSEDLTLKISAEELRLYKPTHSIPIQQSGADSESASSKPNRAAVLVCLFQGDNGDLRVILTKRSSNLSSHSGEVSLPGGKKEEGDADDIETAMREAKEEIGLDPSLVNVVTVLEPFVNKVNCLRIYKISEEVAEDGINLAISFSSMPRGMIVVPVVGILSDKKAFVPAPNASEVEAVFDTPLEMFLKDENRRAEEREWVGDKYLLHYFDYETDNRRYVIWASTAGILIRLASIVYQRPPAFLERKPKFWSRTII